jgi:hypothetical protein
MANPPKALIPIRKKVKNNSFNEGGRDGFILNHIKQQRK